MTAQRKNLKSNIDTLDRMLDLINYKKDVLVEYSSESELEKLVDYVNKIKVKRSRSKALRLCLSI